MSTMQMRTTINFVARFGSRRRDMTMRAIVAKVLIPLKTMDITAKRFSEEKHQMRLHTSWMKSSLHTRFHQVVHRWRSPYFKKLLILLSCSKVYLRNENISIHSINNTKCIMNVGSMLVVTTLSLSHSLHSSWHALVQRFQVRQHNLIPN